jgi:nucleoside-diphosphate-sugar epimerase
MIAVSARRWWVNGTGVTFAATVPSRRVAMGKMAVVLGISGQIGTATARRLLAEGWSVRGLHDGSRKLPEDLAGVTAERGDRNDDTVVAAALAEGADAVVDTIAYNSTHARQLLAHATGIGVLVVISSVDVYADGQGRSVNSGKANLPVPTSESQPLVPADDATYGGGKVMLERILLDSARVPVVVLRPAAVCGPRSRHLREWWFIKRALDGRRVVPLKYGGRSRFHPASTANIAGLAAHCIGRATTEVLNIADPDCPTVHEIGDHVAGVMRHEWQPVPLTEEQSTGPVGETPWSGPTPLVFDTSRALATGYRPVTTYAAAMPSLVAAALDEVAGRDWTVVYPDLARYPGDQFDYAAEDDLLRGVARP